ncbi:MAG: phage GP46 family protein [Chitinispirillia bacterium]|nr:phage GP46 family protein [Chitinispirillia bacterium]MCL2268608.1 phage GP46 family protein [Chitinispirillia bacterium]
MDFSIEVDEDGRPYATLDPGDDVQNAVLLSLYIRRGSWFMNPAFGSHIHEIKTLSDRDVALAQRYGWAALEWMKVSRMVRDISVSATAYRGGLLNMDIKVVRRDGAEITYETFFKVV